MAKPDAYAVNEMTWRANHKKDLVLSRAVNVLADPKRAERRAQGECLACFYIDTGRIAGQAFTEWKCRICEQEQPMWPNTAVPRLCVDCACKFGLCRECMADDELRPRRKINMVRRPKKRAGPAPGSAATGGASKGDGT